MLKGRALNGWEKNVVGDEASSLDDSWNSVDPAAPSVSTGILATTYRGFPSRAIGSHLQGSRGYWLPFIGVSRAEFLLLHLFTSIYSCSSRRAPFTYLFTYLPTYLYLAYLLDLPIYWSDHCTCSLFAHPVASTKLPIPHLYPISRQH